MCASGCIYSISRCFPPALIVLIRMELIRSRVFPRNDARHENPHPQTLYKHFHINSATSMMQSLLQRRTGELPND